MKQRSGIALFLLLGLAACEQSNQELPFSVGTQSAQKTVPADGGIISTAAGASVEFPSGSLSSPTQVTLTPVSTPAAVSQSGAAASGGFQLEPAGTVLQEPASVDLKFDQSTDPQRAWLASVVNLVNGVVEEHADTRVDLSTSLVTSDISRLGTLSVVIPEPDAVVQVTAKGSARDVLLRAPDLAATGTDSVVIHCGDPSNRCSGLSVTATSNLLSKVADAAAVYPKIDGALKISGSNVSGEVTLNTSARAILQSGQTAENVVVNARISPTASSTVVETASAITFTNMLHSISGSSDSLSGAKQVIADLVISKATPSVTITRDFTITGDSGASEPASVSLVFPIQFYQ